MIEKYCPPDRNQEGFVCSQCMRRIRGYRVCPVWENVRKQAVKKARKEFREYISKITH